MFLHTKRDKDQSEFDQQIRVTSNDPQRVGITFIQTR